MGWFGYYKLILDWRKYNKQGGKASLSNFYPCLSDRTSVTPFDPQYFYQAAWAISRIHTNKPELHIDVGSDVKYVGMLSGVCKVEFVDIRPLEVNLPNFYSKTGSILALPYKDNSVSSISALHVIEHIGLGRYGDPIDPRGTDKACAELERVLAKGGVLYLSVPIGSPRVQFNGQRILSIDELLNFLPKLTLIEMSFVDNNGKYHDKLKPSEILYNESARSDFALGCFVFKK